MNSVNRNTERVNEHHSCRRDALRGLECEEEMPAMPDREAGLTAWDWLGVLVGGLLGCLLFYIAALGWSLLWTIGGAR